MKQVSRAWRGDYFILRQLPFVCERDATQDLLLNLAFATDSALAPPQFALRPRPRFGSLRGNLYTDSFVGLPIIFRQRELCLR